MGGIAESILDAVADLGGPLLVLVTFLLGLGESAIGMDLVVPGEVGMVVVGAAGARGGVSPVALVAAGSAGAFAGDSVSYVIGRRLGRPLLCRWAWVGRRMEPKIAKSEQYFAERGSWTIVVARWVGALRAVVPFVAGMSHFPYRRFALWDAPAVVAWCTAVVTIGYVFGEEIAELVDRVGLAVSGVVITLLIGWWLWKRYRRSATGGGVKDRGHEASRRRGPWSRAVGRGDSGARP